MLLQVLQDLADLSPLANFSPSSAQSDAALGVQEPAIDQEEELIQVPAPDDDDTKIDFWSRAAHTHLLSAVRSFQASSYPCHLRARTLPSLCGIPHPSYT